MYGVAVLCLGVIVLILSSHPAAYSVAYLLIVAGIGWTVEDVTPETK